MASPVDARTTRDVTGISVSTKRRWIDDIVAYFQELGGDAHYSELYAHIESHPRRPLSREWQATVRYVIERHSSDTTIYKIENPDLFHSVGGLGSGHWALREAEAAAVTLEISAIPIEDHQADSYGVAQTTAEIIAMRREAALVKAFAAHLKAHGIICERQRIRPAGVVNAFLTDIFIPSLNVLIEAKGNVSRNSFRMALGQLADYMRFYDRPQCAVLLPFRPVDDLIRLAVSQNTIILWPEGDEDRYAGLDALIHQSLVDGPINRR